MRRGLTEIPGGSVTSPLGFRAAAVRAGIRKEGPDLALILCDGPDCAAAGIFTTNLVQAAPVVLSREHLRASRGRARAILANSGNANAATGAAGLRAARRSARDAAALLGITPEEVLVASTGVIGRPLPADGISRALPEAVSALSVSGGDGAARAILTTDGGPKTCAVRIPGPRPGTVVTIGGIAKGAGMIHPSMATMLAFVATDARVSPPVLRQALRTSAEASFNRITVDGDTSTNDCVFLLASGASGVAVRPAPDPFHSRFLEALAHVCRSLALAIVRDGEGATKLVAIRVVRAPDAAAALRVARTVATSLLVKTALYGEQANWGRIIAAAGRAGVPFDPARSAVRIGGITVFRRGLPAGVPDSALSPILGKREYEVLVDLGAGKAGETVWTCDLSHRYVDINGSYIS